MCIIFVGLWHHPVLKSLDITIEFQLPAQVFERSGWSFEPSKVVEHPILKTRAWQCKYLHFPGGKTNFDCINSLLLFMPVYAAVAKSFHIIINEKKVSCVRTTWNIFLRQHWHTHSRNNIYKFSFLFSCWSDICFDHTLLTTFHWVARS